MQLTTVTEIEAPIDIVWPLQFAHTEWPAHFPAVRAAAPRSPGSDFGVGSVVAITQPGLGTVDWTVTEFSGQGDERTYAWTGRGRGATYVARHTVTALGQDRCRLVLELGAKGPTITLLGAVLRRRMQETIDTEAANFGTWARSLAGR